MFYPKYAHELTRRQRKESIRALVFLKQKCTGIIKGRSVADGRPQRAVEGASGDDLGVRRRARVGLEACQRSDLATECLLCASTCSAPWHNGTAPLCRWPARCPHAENASKAVPGLTLDTRPECLGCSYSLNSTDALSWSNPSDVEFVYSGVDASWAEERCSVDSVSAVSAAAGDGAKITMKQPCFWNPIKNG